MSSRLGIFGASLVAAAAMLLTGSGAASATTFCVPDFSAVCPNSNGNIKSANLETAMGLDSIDGVTDTIYMGAYTYTDADSLTPADFGTDDLKIIGSGTDKSFITSSSTNNGFVMNMKSRKLDMSGVTIVIPSTFPDSGGNGAGLQADDGTFDHVDIKSLNKDSGGAPSLSGETTWKNSHIYGANGGTIDIGIEPNIGPGRLEITNMTIDDSTWAIVADKGDIPVIVKRSRINLPVGYGAIIENGTKFIMENSLIVAGNTPAILASTGNKPAEEDIDASIRASTIVAGRNPATSALKIEIKDAPGSQSANIDVSDSIIKGFANTWDVANPVGVGLGTASLSLTSSDFNPVGLPDGPSAVSAIDPSNINANPMFKSASDFHLLPGSPAIDAGATNDTGIVEDNDGTARPLDGNGDGIKVRDMGAFEAPTVPSCASDKSLCPDTSDKVAPVIGKVRFKSPKKKAGKLTFRLSEDATITATFRPKKAGKSHGRKLKTVKLVRNAKAGTVRIRLKKGKLKPGRYRLTVSATDGAGNTSSKQPAIAARVPKPGR